MDKNASLKKILLAKPRGFCAGVARSIDVVEQCLAVLGAPIYVKHTIVHNATVVARLAAQGAITVENIDDVPDGATVVFSAHGSPPEHFARAKEKNLRVIDATCPLVTKVHIEMARFAKDGIPIVYIGHRGHVEGEGVVGEARRFGVTVPIIEDERDIADVPFPEGKPLAVLTQTTLNVEKTTQLIAALRRRYSAIIEPSARDICYATTNRQHAVTILATQCEVVLIVGSPTSSNSNRLVEVAHSAGARAYLVENASEIDPVWLNSVVTLGISAGASAPEENVQEIVEVFKNPAVSIEELIVKDEDLRFTPPRELETVMRSRA